MKIFPKSNYLTEEQSQAFLDLWNNQPVLRSGFKSKIVKSGAFIDKFQVTQKQIEEFHSNEVFKKIIHAFSQDLNGFTIPLFTYSLKDKRYLLISDSKRYLKEGCIRNLKWAKTCARFDSKITGDIQSIIDKLY